jgi:RNA polymerase sigma-70 factor (ECF subfamily)
MSATAIMSEVIHHSRADSAAQQASRDDIAAELFTGHYGRLAGWVRRLVDDDGTAHEIASEAFTRLLSRLHKVDDPPGYLYVIAANLVRDHWRRTGRERRALRREATQPSASMRDSTPDIDIRELVDRLPERLRVPVLLHYFADFPVREVARLVGRPEGTIKSDLFAARAELRKALEGAR